MSSKTDRDIDILLPDRDVTVTDPDTRKAVEVTVREFRFLEGLKAQGVAAPLLADLAAALTDSSGDIGVAAVDAALTTHAGVWTALLALAVAKPSRSGKLPRPSSAPGTDGTAKSSTS
ncbi:MAG: hypothetical protein OXI11_08230 [Gammaproteobacteria bacterium]|nr:hypothetical protein [Gammaproteobacteria bacterium]MDE2655254.1 hypothetical protein [Gemmatimonadota bacterium]MXW45228.1 hypothetical protein [Gammaproteobacteria bacterium]MYD01144.1 hypothetical protein [Gammaproteobacteria bacterium]MYI24892.1 hypothetical protein [Gammaproteobacteria bacterium]